MVEKQKYQAYASATQTVAPVRQIILLYEGTIRLVQQAKEAIAENRIEDRYHLLIKASELVGGLQSCLDFENGGEIARILYSYYSGIDARLFAIHRTNSVEDCDAIITDLKQMRDSWSDVEGSSSAAPQTSNVSGFPASANTDVPAAMPSKPEGMILSA